MANPMSYQNSKSEPLVKQGLYPVMSSGLLSSPLSQTTIQPINFGYDETKEHCLSDDEYYLEKLRKENLLKTVKNMKEEQIFLFEVFVDAIHILKENELLEPLQQYGPLPPLRVRIQFGTVPCFDIHEEEILITQSNINDEDMLTGKVIRLGQENQGWQQHVDHGEWKSAYG
uniref:Uncharacterized protein n=3 Tax=Clastoptera arizonana TaxID=38151 RepID=A0A1B6CTE3_9HEMI